MNIHRLPLFVSMDRRRRFVEKIASPLVVAAVVVATLAVVAFGPTRDDASFAGRAWAKGQDRETRPPSSDRTNGAERTDAADRVREGTRWQNERGTFTLVGDRVTFTNQKSQSFVALENLNLERIVRTIEENRTVTDAETLDWNVDATVTEFRGVNFVLVTRSVLVARPRATNTGR